MPNIYFEEIEVGDPVTPLTKPPVTRVQISRYAGASDDYSPLHIDDEFAKTAGYGGVFAHGAIAMGFAVEAVSKWLENGRIWKIESVFQKLVWPGDIITAKGVVVQLFEEGDDACIEVDIWSENQNGDVVMRGKATCILWRDEKHERRVKGLWPPITTKPNPPKRPSGDAPAKAKPAAKKVAKKAAKKVAKKAAKKTAKKATKKATKKVAKKATKKVAKKASKKASKKAAKKSKKKTKKR